MLPLFAIRDRPRMGAAQRCAVPALGESARTSSAAAVCCFALALAAASCTTGCRAANRPARTGTKSTTSQPHYPTRPANPPPAFKVFHHDASSFTLVTKEDAADAEIEALIWQLHDAAQAHRFNTLKIDQKAVDARDPILWFHIYRGAKCASEKYTTGKLPCGASYHAAGDYTLGGFTNPQRDEGVLIHDEDHTVELWNPDAASSH